MSSFWVAIDNDGEHIFQERPVRQFNSWLFDMHNNEEFRWIDVPKGTIKRILGYEISEYETVEVTEDTLNNN